MGWSELKLGNWVNQGAMTGFISILKAIKPLGILAVLLVCLSGCVRYDVGIHYRDQHHGEIVQSVQLSQQFASLNPSVVKTWTKSIERRTNQLGGRVQRVSDEELLVTIPFNNAKDLEAKFNEFFQALAQLNPSTESDSNHQPLLESHLTLTENNFLVVLRDRLQYDLDLRSLGVRSATGEILLGPGNLLNLVFHLQTPWGVQAVTAYPEPALRGDSDDRQVVWALKPGEVNHLEATFWIPSPLGIGTVVIVGITSLGAFLRSKLIHPN